VDGQPKTPINCRIYSLCWVVRSNDCKESSVTRWYRDVAPTLLHNYWFQLAGATYLDIHAAGGGINFTVSKTRQASSQDLLGSFLARVEAMKRKGTTTVECKSGYGLEWEAELKMLSVLEQARARTPITISSTFCAAHSVPKYVISSLSTYQLPRSSREFSSNAD
jgi:imidazolonepropionase